jgi:dihydropteroate synthase
MKPQPLICRDRVLPLGGEPAIMGILNVTPDSFSDGGKYFDADAAAAHGLAMARQGAKIIDVGGESTRPGAPIVSEDEQIRRTIPAIRQIARQANVIVSIDTTSSRVAAAAIEAGARMINDISALRFDPAMAALAVRSGAAVVLMHMQGTPATMQLNPTYQDVVGEVKAFLAERIDYAVGAGIDRGAIVVDPGIGFGKTVDHNLLLLNNLRRFHDLNQPILVGSSRKAFIGRVLGESDPANRLFGTAAAAGWCAAAGVQILRVHDVEAMVQVVRLTTAIRDS